MSRQYLAMAIAALGLAACVTTSTLPTQSEASSKEAAQINMQLGVGYLRQGDLKTAQAKLEKALAEDDSLATAYTALGVVFERLGDLRAAEKNYRRGVELAESDPDALNAFAAFLCQKEAKPAEAMRYFDQALAIPLSKANTNRAMLLTNAGTCMKRLDLAKAEDYLRQALAANPNYSDALLQLADVTFERQSYLPARAFLERYLAVKPATPDALWLGYRIETAMGESAEAARYAERLKKEFPASVETGLLLASERNAR